MVSGIYRLIYPDGFIADGVNFGPLFSNAAAKLFAVPVTDFNGLFIKSFIPLNASDAAFPGSFKKLETPGIEVAAFDKTDNPATPLANPLIDPVAIEPDIILFAPATTPTTDATEPTT
jgi:hypothetical protein